MAKETPNNVNEQPADAQQVVPEVVSKAQYEAVVKQVQDLATEANRRITILETDKKVLQQAIQIIDRLTENKGK